MYSDNTRMMRNNTLAAPITDDTANDAMMEMNGNNGQTACDNGKGCLPGPCAAMAFPFIAMQPENARRYGQQEALREGTLFPGLNLPFHRELESRFPATNTALSELMALDFAIKELGLYLDTHRSDEDALALFCSYVKLAREGREKYVEAYGPLKMTDCVNDGFRWLDDPWPWEKGGND